MDDPAVVRRVQRVGNLPRDVERLIERQRSAKASRSGRFGWSASREATIQRSSRLGWSASHEVTIQRSNRLGWSASLLASVECFALDELHDERAHAARFFQAVNLSDVWMVEGGQQLRLTLEPREAIGIGRENLRQHLDRDFATELYVARSIDFAHSAGTDGGVNFILAEADAGCERHG
jgi:hypothetical protein